jgi:hypothetical protein
LDVDAAVIPEGGSVGVQWEAQGADEVFVDGIGGFGPSGVTHVVLHSSRDVVVRAVGRGGHDTRSTGLVRVVAAPRIAAISVPSAPPIRLNADVQVRFDRSVSALSRLDAVIDMQRATRAAGTDTTAWSKDLRTRVASLGASVRSAVPNRLASRRTR